MCLIDINWKRHEHNHRQRVPVASVAADCDNPQSKPPSLTTRAGTNRRDASLRLRLVSAQDLRTIVGICNIVPRTQCRDWCLITDAAGSVNTFFGQPEAGTIRRDSTDLREGAQACRGLSFSIPTAVPSAFTIRQPRGRARNHRRIMDLAKGVENRFGLQSSTAWC